MKESVNEIKKSRKNIPIDVICKCGCNRVRQVHRRSIKKNYGLFYSNQCKIKWEQEHPGEVAVHDPDILKIKNTCITCNSEFLSEGRGAGSAAYCSEECKKINRNRSIRRKKQLNSRTFECECCSKKTTVIGLGSGNKKYCSEECQKKAKNRKQHPIEEKPCKKCGVLFTATKKVKYCSKACSEYTRTTDWIYHPRGEPWRVDEETAAERDKRKRQERRRFAAELRADQKKKDALMRERAQAYKKEQAEAKQKEQDLMWYLKRKQDKKYTDEGGISIEDIPEKFLTRGNPSMASGESFAGAYVG